ncbi:hypothetical protein ACO3VM_01600 [Methanocaldococcus sp. 10A]
MEVCLICTLGNRDIQFKKEYEDDLKKILGDILEKGGNLDSEDLTVKKKDFLEYTKIILENYEKIKDLGLHLPIIEPCLKKYGNIKKIILVPTNQQDVNGINERHKKGDTFIEAEIIKKYLEEKGYNVEIREAKFNAIDLERWFGHISDIINENYEKFDKLIFEIKGGVPTSQEAIRLASLFKNKIEVVEVVKGEIKTTNMKFFEYRIIKEKLKELINNYDYSGALQFEEYIDNKDVINLLKHLNYRLNFDFASAIHYYNDDRLNIILNDKADTIKRFEYLILELLDNMEIELIKEKYANFLARIYRLEEALGQYIILRFLSYENKDFKIKYEFKKRDNSPGYYCRPISQLLSDKFYKINGLGKIFACYFKHLFENNDFRSEYEKYLAESLEEKERNTFIHARFLNTTHYETIVSKIKKYDFKDENAKKIFNELCSIFENIKSMYKNKEINLRNTTIVAHGFNGVSKETINKIIGKDINDYFKENIRKKFCEVVFNKDIKNIFDKYNETLINSLN